MPSPVYPDSHSLRIGVLRDGKICQEIMLPPGAAASVGTSARATVRLAPPGPRRRLFFVVHGTGWALRFSPDMSGRVAVGQGARELAELVNEGRARPVGRELELPLDVRARGKIQVAPGVVLLFQMVRTPPVSLRELRRQDFRPRLLDTDDPVFLGFLSLFSLLAAVFVAYVQTVDTPTLFEMEEVPDRFRQVVLSSVVEPPPPETLDVTPVPDARAKRQRVKAPADEVLAVARVRKHDKPLTPEEARLSEAQRRRDLEREVAEKSLLVKILGSRGASSSSMVVQDFFSTDDPGSQTLDEAIREVGTALVSTDRPGTDFRPGSDGGREDATLGELARASGGESHVGTGPAITAVVRDDGLEVDDGNPGHMDLVAAAINAQVGQITACYERQLKENQGLSGRMEVSWTLQAGRVRDLSLSQNTTQDEELATCVLDRIRRWKFDPSLDNASVLYPFIFAAR